MLLSHNLIKNIVGISHPRSGKIGKGIKQCHAVLDEHPWGMADLLGLCLPEDTAEWRLCSKCL